jgi:hypothetical protein
MQNAWKGVYPYGQHVSAVYQKNLQIDAFHAVAVDTLAPAYLLDCFDLNDTENFGEQPQNYLRGV